MIELIIFLPLLAVIMAATALTMRDIARMHENMYRVEHRPKPKPAKPRRVSPGPATETSLTCIGCHVNGWGILMYGLCPNCWHFGVPEDPAVARLRQELAEGRWPA